MNHLLLADIPEFPSNGRSIQSGLRRRNALLLGLSFLLAASLLGAALPLQTGASPQWAVADAARFWSWQGRAGDDARSGDLGPPVTAVQPPPSLTRVQSNADTSTTSYLWTIYGTVRDNAGAPVQGAAISTSPEPVSVAVSDGDGVYAAHVNIAATTYAASAAKAGYGDLPTTTFTNTEDAQVDLVLPPADNVVRNWGFESGSLQPDWQTSGLNPAVITTTLRHTGAQAAFLGQPAPGFTTPVNLTNSEVSEGGLQMAPDGTGGVHMLWHGDTAVYARRAGDGTWIVPPEPIPAPNSEAWSKFALGPDGTVHIVGTRWIKDQSRIIYAQRPPAGSWSDPVIISEEYSGLYLSEISSGTSPIAVGADATVHLQWNEHLEFPDPAIVYRVLWTSRDASGSWNAPEDFSDFDYDYQNVQMAVYQTGVVHMVWSNDVSETKYACRPAAGPWSRPKIIREGFLNGLELAVEAAGRVHVAWSDNAAYRVWYAQGSCRGAWSTPEAVTVGTWGYPSLAVDRTGTVHMLWLGTDPSPKVQYARRPRGGSWSTPETLAGVAAYPPGGGPYLAVDDTGTAHVVWAGGITGWEPGTIQLYYTYRRGDSGWSWPQNISGAAQWLARESVPEVLAVEGNGRVHAGWYDGTSPVFDVYYASSVLAQETGDSALSQTITVPDGSTHPTLSFMYELGGVSPGSGSSFGVAVNDGIVTTTLSTERASTGWTHRWFDLQPWAGQTVTLIFTLRQVAGEQPAWACLDEVTVGSAHPDTWVSLSGPRAGVPGQKVSYAVTYGNRGGVDALNGQVTLQLPPGLTFISANPPPSAVSPAPRWDVGNLAARGDSYTILATLQVAPSVATGVTLTTAAAITSDSTELEQANDSAQTSIYTERRAYLPVVASSGSSPMCLLYSDDFSGGGWPVHDTLNYSLGYLNSEYRIALFNRATNWVFVRGDFLSSDYRVAVDARAESNPDGGVGLAFGMTNIDPRNFYLFEVRDGWFGLWRHFAVATWTTLIDWRPSAAIRAGSQTNRLEIVRSGDRILLYANGQYLGETTDGEYHGTWIGMWAQRSSSDFDARFDNFAVYTTNACLKANAAAGRIKMSVESGD